MDKAISIYRIVVMFAISMVAIPFLCGIEQCENTAIWFCRTLIALALAIGAILWAALLYRMWSKTDPWLKAYDKMCDIAMDESDLGKDTFNN